MASDDCCAPAIKLRHQKRGGCREMSPEPMHLAFHGEGIVIGSCRWSLVAPSLTTTGTGLLQTHDLAWLLSLRDLGGHGQAGMAPSAGPHPKLPRALSRLRLGQPARLPRPLADDRDELSEPVRAADTRRCDGDARECRCSPPRTTEEAMIKCMTDDNSRAREAQYTSSRKGRTVGKNPAGFSARSSAGFPPLDDLDSSWRFGAPSPDDDPPLPTRIISCDDGG